MKVNGELVCVTVTAPIFSQIAMSSLASIATESLMVLANISGQMEIFIQDYFRQG